VTKPRGVECNPISIPFLRKVGTEKYDKHIEPTGVLPDWAIREFITIEDFVDYDECPPGTVSYGLTSAGYDIRVGYRFKVFTNAWCQTVSPRGINPKCFIDHDLTPRPCPGYIDNEPLTGLLPCNKGFYNFEGDGVTYRCERCKGTGLDPAVADSILIPSNCFALAESVEKLYIPRNVDCWCIGKSTYARCFSEDTRIALVDNRTPTFRQARKLLKRGERLFGYGVDRTTGEYKVTELTNIRPIGDEPVYRIWLDNGSEITCTPDHEFLRHNGAYTRADELRVGNGLVPLYRKEFKGYEQVWIPSLGWLPTHWLADNWNVEHGIYSPRGRTHRHHKDLDRRNNNPANIERISKSDHVKFHNGMYYGDGFDSEQHSESIKIALAKRFADPDWTERYKQLQSRRILNFHYNPEYEEARKERRNKLRKSWTEERKATHSARIKELWAAGKMRPSNHKIVRIEKPKGRRPVWCLESKDTGNFALACGVMAKNCGINMNFTPFEPGWFGIVVVEIINATPLPVEIIAGQGIGQAQFFLMAGEPERDYGQKKNARYQGQTGITLPRVI
jgi:deoxycytidine triphosphate deaminase